MVKVSVEVRSGAAHFEVGVQAESIQRAMCFVKERYPMGSVKVSFPIEPESFFVEDPTVRTEIVGLELPARAAA
jgi:hypothetical protein